MLRHALALTLLALPLTMPSSASAQAKMGSNLVCYDISDPYYAQIHTNRVYVSMVECVDDGGIDRQTAHSPETMAQIETGRAHRGVIPVPVSLSRMSRQFDDLAMMDNWVIDTRHQGCREQRDRLLAHTSNVRVQWHDDACRVRMGHWRDAIDGKRLVDPETIELTHLVPLSWAEQRGATEWTAEMRHRFYHDRRNLITTTPQGRAAMEGRTPMDWRPYAPWSACHNAQTFWQITTSYPLAMTPQERIDLVAAVEAACQPMDRGTVVAIQQAQQDLAQAQRDAIDAARAEQTIEVDALRAQNAPPAPSYIRLPDGSTRALTMEERWGGTWRTHFRDQQNVVVVQEPQNTVSTIQQAPIATPGVYTRNPDAALDQDPNGATRFGQQGNMMATGQTNVGGPNDFGDFGEVVLPPELEGLDRMGDDLPELDEPGNDPRAVMELLRNGIPGLSPTPNTTQPQAEPAQENPEATGN